MHLICSYGEIELSYLFGKYTRRGLEAIIFLSGISEIFYYFNERLQCNVWFVLLIFNNLVKYLEVVFFFKFLSFEATAIIFLK